MSLNKKMLFAFKILFVTIFYMPVFVYAEVNTHINATIKNYNEFSNVPDFGEYTGAILKDKSLNVEGVTCYSYKDNISLQKVYDYVALLEKNGFKVKKISKHIGALSGSLYYLKDDLIVYISINGARGYKVNLGKINKFSYLDIPDESYDLNGEKFIKFSFEAMVVNNNTDYIFDNRAKQIHIQYNDWYSGNPVDYWVNTFVIPTNEEKIDIVKTDSLLYQYRGIHEFDIEVYSSNKWHNSKEDALNSSILDSKLLTVQKHVHTFLYRDGVWVVESRQHYDPVTGVIQNCSEDTSWWCIEKQINFY